MKTKKTPMRRCIGCMESKPKGELVRIACYEGRVSPDPTGRAKGRGVYLCPREECIDKAIRKKALQRNFKTDIDGEEAEAILRSVIQRENDEGGCLNEH